MAKKRSRVDSPKEQSRIVSKAFQRVEPPKHIKLSKKERDIFDTIIEELPRSDWTEHRKQIAANLSKVIIALEYEYSMIDKEGTVITNRFGDLVANPRIEIAAKFTGQILSMRRTLSIHERGQSGESRDLKKRRSAAKKVEEAARDSSDDLINRPSIH